MGTAFDPHRVRAVLFDLDGTLITTEKITTAPNSLAHRLAITVELPLNYILAMLDRARIDYNAFGLVDRFRRIRGLGTQGNFKLIDGTADLLHYLRGRYALGIVTTRARRDVLAFLDQYALADYFAVVTTRQDVWCLKPHPAPVQYSAAKLGVVPQECLLVGDTVLDVRCAKATGAYAAAVLSGFGEREELARAKPDLLLESAAQLREWL